MTKEISQEKSPLVMRVSISDSIRAIAAGESAVFDCREAGPMASAKSCVSRLNKAAGREEYKITSPDNGVTYQVTHIA